MATSSTTTTTSIGEGGHQVGNRVWVLEDSNAYDGGFAFGMFNSELLQRNDDGTWRVQTLGFFTDQTGDHPEIQESVPENRIFVLSKPAGGWVPPLGTMCLGWKVLDGEPPGGWWVGRIVRVEWRGLYEREDTDVYTIQWLTNSGWEVDQNEWDRVRPACVLPFPEELRPHIPAKYLSGP
eukprot:TRINITY_DN64750_c0_g1_i1.p2 TRINITY_DN64750_c0_g1~~TRINITY_DN64750_c0_g1_i1.p2  ORF type:complete len:180 (-),score=21.09 TRINITY_DN64750_c0_g1_i1:800-1339(-)